MNQFSEQEKNIDALLESARNATGTSEANVPNPGVPREIAIPHDLVGGLIGWQGAR